MSLRIWLGIAVVLIAASATAFSAVAQDPCEISHVQPMEVANEGGYEFTYQSSAGLYPDQHRTHCSVYRLQNRPGRPKTGVRWTGNLANTDPLIDVTLAECGANQPPAQCPGLKNTAPSNYGRALWPSTLGWGFNKSQYTRKPTAWQNPGSGERLAKAPTAFLALRSSVDGSLVTHDNRTIPIRLELTSLVEGAGPFVLKYEFRIFGGSSRFLVGVGSHELADFPVVFWRAAQSNLLEKELASHPRSFRTFKAPPDVISLSLPNIKSVEVNDASGVVVSWSGQVELLASAPAYRPKD